MNLQKISSMNYGLNPFLLVINTLKQLKKKHGSLTYVGAGSSIIAEGNDKLRLETGTTQDILCMFTIKGYEINRKTGEAEIDAMFENRKNKDVTVLWTEQFSDGRWDIVNANSDYKRLDANRALFVVDIPAMSKKEINFKARIGKE